MFHRYISLKLLTLNLILQAQIEFDNFKQTLTSSGIKVVEFCKKDSRAPDAIFPDWFTTHKNDDIPDGVFILYPMKHYSRQLERDHEIID